VVLIVEDEALVRMTAVDMIEEAGFEVLEATNADEAILLLEARRDITVVFTDIEMPGFDGRPQARPGRQGPMAAHQNYRDIGPLHRTGRRSAVRRAVPGKTLHL
jgi:CheY-like chemotaxis protein